jgi:hypothetical protein
MSGVNPQGCQVFSFKHPTATELDHDFLWRTTQALPERGRIGIFNRSYYEEVLIVRVHPEILRAQGLPDPRRAGKKIWPERYRSIVELEAHLHRNGTRIFMKPKPPKPEKDPAKDLATFERLPAKTKELSLLQEQAEKSTGPENGVVQKQIREKSR